jgi:hypothetical protein
MATAGGPNIERDGLVFGYDTGYGVADNNTATRFYPGEPTTNFMPTIYKAGATSSGTDEIGDYFEGTITRIGCPNGTSIDSGATYTFSIEIRADKTFNMSADSNQYAPENAGNDANRVSVSYIMPNYTTPGKWVKYSTTVVMKSGLTNPYMFDFFIPQSFTGRMYYRNAQLEYKNNPTPFVNGTRSSTQSLIDLKRTADIDVSNVSFDSTGQPTFDGTNDKIVIADQTSIGAYTYETVVKINNSDSSYSGFGSNYKSDASGYSGVGNGWVLRLDPSGNFQVYTKNNSTTLINPINISGFRASNSNKYIHLVYTYEDGSNKIYLNGVLQQTGTGLSGETASDSTLIIGAYSWGISSQTYYLNGHQPVTKLYNTTFSAEEVKQNFNAYKNRFNI